MRVFALSYSILLCPFWLSSLGGLLFSEEKWSGEWIWGRWQEELGGVKRRKIVIGICCIKEVENLRFHLHFSNAH